MSIYMDVNDRRPPDDAHHRYVSRVWGALIFILLVSGIVALSTTSIGHRFILLYRQPLAWFVTGLIVFQFAGVALYAFMYPQNRKSIRNRLVLAILSLFMLPAIGLGMQPDMMRAFGQTGVAVQQCFGPASASFKSAAFPQLACLQAWNTPYAVVERRKIAEFSQKECLKQEDEKISSNVESAMSQFNAFDSKDKVVSAFRSSNIPLESADGQTYFANIHTHCLDDAGYDKNAQFKVVVLASFTAGSLVRDVTVSSSNASPFNSVFAKNGVAESYRVDYENKRRLASIGESLTGLFASKSKSSSGGAGDVALSDLRLSCAGADCVAQGTLSGTLINHSTLPIRSVSIHWGVERDGRCDQSMTDMQTISFNSNEPLGEREQRSFSVSVAVPEKFDAGRSSNLCGSIARID